MTALSLLVLVTETPEPEDVTAGWLAFAIFLLLGLAVVFLGWSLTKHLRKAQEAKDLGVYGDEPPTPEGPVEDAAAPGTPTPGSPTP